MSLPKLHPRVVFVDRRLRRLLLIYTPSEATSGSGTNYKVNFSPARYWRPPDLSEIYRSRRINNGKFRNFTPAEPAYTSRVGLDARLRARSRPVQGQRQVSGEQLEVLVRGQDRQAPALGDGAEEKVDAGRTISGPIVWYPRLAYGTAAERANFQIAGAGYGIQWPDLDEDIGVEGLVLGKRSMESPESFERWL